MPQPAAPPLVTFFVMAFKQEDVVREAIEGAFAQTYPNLEIVLSDDCSPDGTFRVMQEMAEAYDGPHLVRLNRNPTNLGINAHLNRIMEIARGAFIIQNAGDDVSSPDRALRLTEAWLASGEDEDRALLVHSAAEIVDDDGCIRGLREARRGLLKDATPQAAMAQDLCVLGATMGWDRRLFDRFGPLPEDAAVEDITMTFRALFHGALPYVETPLLRWRAGGLSFASPEHAFHPFGPRLKFARWRAQAHRHALADLAKIEFAGRAECRRIALYRSDLHGLEADLAEASSIARLALAPWALMLAFRHRSPLFPKAWLRHVFRRPYLWLWERRRARKSTV